MAETGIEILNAKQPEDARRWTALVTASPLPDVYYLPEYALATAEVEKTEATALIAGPSSSRILAPLLIRHMSATANVSNLDWIDAATPYGYGGMLSLADSGIPGSPALRCFFQQLHGWCSSQGIVCCVIRLQPVTAQHEWFSTQESYPTEDEYENLHHVDSQRRTSSIDCDNWDETEDLPNGMNHGRHEDMRLARRALRATWTEGDDPEIKTSLNIFANLYNEMLDRIGTESFYRFPPGYYSGLTKLGRHIGVVIAWREDKPVGANIALAGAQFAYGHLSATNHEGRKHGASTLLNVEEARWARRKGCRLLYLGGGMQPGDGIEKYKSSFGGPSHTYGCLTYVADQQKFDRIRALPNPPWPYNVPLGSKS